MICRDGSVGAAGQTAPTKGYQPPLKMLFVVVVRGENIIIYILWLRQTVFWFFSVGCFRQLNRSKFSQIFFVLALSSARCSLLVTRKNQSANWSCSTQFVGFAVPMPSVAAGPSARCLWWMSSRTVAEWALLLAMAFAWPKEAELVGLYLSSDSTLYLLCPFTWK